MSGQVAIGIDIGGTNLKGAAVDRAGAILARGSVPTDIARGPDRIIADILVLSEGLLGQAGLTRASLVGAGVGVPGPLDPTTGRIIRAVNLPGWVDVPLRDLLQTDLQTPVVLDNDGNAAAFGEFWAGVGNGEDDLVMLTLGTGVGAGVVLGRRLVHGHFQNAAELGHMITAIDGLPCNCGQRGCLEQYASAAGVAARVAAALWEGETSAIAKDAESGEPIDSRRVVEHAKAGDPLCLRIWDEACVHLAVACVNIQHAFNPAHVVFGGGMSEAGAFLVDRVVGHVVRRRWTLHDDFPSISLAKLGYDAGVVGAAGLVWQAHLDSAPGRG